ncbi:MAG: sugar phosphate nucleotidyltransferase [Bryobacterales bacterium]|nr:sugar phosphate nucleotidyltransferase [Bryobacterales bacterium]
MGRGPQRHAVIIAGGRGARFWPRSRIDRPKQLLAPLGGPTLLRRTFERLRGSFPAENIWVVTARHLLEAVSSELPELPPGRLIGEPVARGTAPAAGLAAALILRQDPDALMGVFPADHHIGDEQQYVGLLESALTAAEADRLVVLGIRPQRPETGFGYIEFADPIQPGHGQAVPVTRFREKPDRRTAEEFLRSGRHYWNSGQFFWRAAVLAQEMLRHLPDTWNTLAAIADSDADRLGGLYGECANVSVDTGILERSDRVWGLAAPDIGWSDLGSWESLRALLPQDADGNCSPTPSTLVRSAGNYLDVPSKHVALLGVSDLVIVETPDALLVCPRQEAQNLSEVTSAIADDDHEHLL